MADRDIAGKPADYQADIAHLLPAEITAFYISVKGIIPFDGPDKVLNNEYLVMSFVFGILLIAFFYVIMPYMLQISGRLQRILYLATFLVWLLSIDIDHIVAMLQIFAPTGNGPILARIVINLSVAVWSFSVPFLFRAASGTLPPVSSANAVARK